MIKYLAWRVWNCLKYTGEQIDRAVSRENVLRSMVEVDFTPVRSDEIPDVVKNCGANYWRGPSAPRVRTSCFSSPGSY